MKTSIASKATAANNMYGPSLIITPALNGYVVQAFDEYSNVLVTAVATDTSSSYDHDSLNSVIKKVFDEARDIITSAMTPELPVDPANSDDPRNYPKPTTAWGVDGAISAGLDTAD